MSSVSAYWRLARLFPRLLALATFLMIVDAVFSTISVVTVAPLADLFLSRPESEWTGVTRTMKDMLEHLQIGFSVLSVATVVWLSMFAMSVVSVLVRWSALRIRYAVVRHLLMDSYDDLFRADWSYFASAKRGELINTFVREIHSVGTGFHAVSASIANFVRVAALLAVPLTLQPALVGICIAASGLALVPFLLMGKWSYRFGQGNVAASNRLTSLVRESLDAAKEVIGFGRREYTVRHIANAYDDYANYAVRSGTTSFFSSQMYEPAGFFILLAVLTYASSSGVAVTAIAVVLWGSLRTIPLLKQVITYKHQIDNLLPSLEQVQRQQQAAKRHAQAYSGVSFSGFRSGIRVDNIDFSYANDGPAIKQLSLRIPKGQAVALVGESGSGKSTLADLLIGLQRPDSGEIYVDDLELAKYDALSWRSRLGLVPQRPVLFDLSVRDNLLWAKPDATEEEVWQACRVAGADRFVRDLPHGLDTEIGDNGVRLSGGQAQRLALARALIRKPEFLVLDEATSALDSETEAAVYATLMQHIQGITVLIIAHRLSTIAQADSIVVMRDGAIVEQGDFDLLVQANGYFKRLLDLQSYA